MSSPAPVPSRLRNAWLIPAGATIALVGAMCGIGGGLFTVPLLHFGARLPLKQAVATSLVLVLTTALTSTVTELVRPDSALSLPVVLTLAGGVLIGAQLGFRVARRINTKHLRQVFAVVLVLAGLRMFQPTEVIAAGDALVDWSPGALDMALVFAIGIGGGFTSPLLGVGGGLIFVPALYVGVPELGFAGARACSLAAAVISAGRSVWLFMRLGAIRTEYAVWLATGALFGAVAGVLVVHQPGWTDYARQLLAVILWIVAIRFTREAWLERRATVGPAQE